MGSPSRCLIGTYFARVVVSYNWASPGGGSLVVIGDSGKQSPRIIKLGHRVSVYAMSKSDTAKLRPWTVQFAATSTILPSTMSTLQLNLNPTMGSVLIGALFSALFYGSTLAQVAYYSWHYLRRDRLLVKTLVFCTLTLDTVITISDVGIVWSYVVQGHAQLLALTVVPKIFAVQYAMLRATICVVQIFYIHGIWRLFGQSRSTYNLMRLTVTIPPMVLSLLAFISGLVGVYDTATHGWIITNTLRPDVVPSAINNCAAAGADVCICIALCWMLRSRMTGFKNTDNVIRTLTVYIVNRGILTTVIQIVNLGMFLSSIAPSTLTWFIFNCAGVKMYVNSMMAVLNARQHLNSGSDEVSYVSGFTEGTANLKVGARKVTATDPETVCLDTYCG
ncbi:uncharacterized protein B0H18DRAFT_360518 [Fomitopsis serialis]|uniref:uncharacterized protein n=1 Tax=Fomitopsis serialis TaxID=139415 RepID=UPI0020076F58|nr:uncharacterized protein B0H18DRAFT_360518 [Neoantrodia serialis]KAH9926030.1 hypothetical protein B0H18DRAFT_360518 [Neoantrodia serialis]